MELIQQSEKMVVECPSQCFKSLVTLEDLVLKAAALEGAVTNGVFYFSAIKLDDGVMMVR